MTGLTVKHFRNIIDIARKNPKIADEVTNLINDSAAMWLLSLGENDPTTVEELCMLSDIQFFFIDLYVTSNVESASLGCVEIDHGIPMEFADYLSCDCPPNVFLGLAYSLYLYLGANSARMPVFEHARDVWFSQYVQENTRDIVEKGVLLPEKNEKLDWSNFNYAQKATLVHGILQRIVRDTAQLRRKTDCK